MDTHCYAVTIFGIDRREWNIHVLNYNFGATVLITYGFLRLWLQNVLDHNTKSGIQCRCKWQTLIGLYESKNQHSNTDVQVQALYIQWSVSVRTVGTYSFVAVISAIIVRVTDEQVRDALWVGALKFFFDFTRSYTHELFPDYDIFRHKSRFTAATTTLTTHCDFFALYKYTYLLAYLYSNWTSGSPGFGVRGHKTRPKWKWHSKWHKIFSCIATTKLQTVKCLER